MEGNDLIVEGAQRRKFLSSIVSAGVTALLPNATYAMSEVEPASICGEVSAADSLYLYHSLIPRLQSSAIQQFRRNESEAFRTFTEQLEKIWKVADRLRAKLPKQSTYLPPIHRLDVVTRVAKLHSHATPASDKRDFTIRHPSANVSRLKGSEK